MNRSMFLVVVFSALLYTSRVVETQMCVCERNLPNVTTTWGSWSNGDPSECIGDCSSATRQRTRNCELLNENGDRLGSTPCSVSIPCQGECRGEWSSWGNRGSCSVGCGEGVQLMERFCYKRGRPDNLRVKSCLGEAGVDEQIKNETCRRMNNCGNTTTQLTTTTPTPFIPRIPTTTPKVILTTPELSTPKATPVPSTPSSIISTTSDTAPANVSDVIGVDQDVTPLSSSTVTTTTVTTQSTTARSTRRANRNNPLTSPVIQATGGINTVALAAVLGTAAIISVTVVAITAAIVFLKKKSPDPHVVSYTTSNGEAMVAAVALSRRDLPDEQTIIPHILYEFDSTDGDTVLGNGINRQRSPSRNPESEAVYFTVDDRSKD